MAIELRNLPRSSMIAAAKAVKAVAAQEGTRAGGPLVGKKRRGLKLRARDEIRTAGTVTTCRIQGVSPAGWVWVSYGTRPHQIRRRKRGPMKVMTVHHPGTRGRGGWDRVAQRAAVIVPAIFDDQVARVVR
jgi:hypothetical protein